MCPQNIRDEVKLGHLSNSYTEKSMAPSLGGHSVSNDLELDD